MGIVGNTRSIVQQKGQASGMLLYMYLNITNREEQLLYEFLVSIATGLFVDQFFDL